MQLHCMPVEVLQFCDSSRVQTQAARTCLQDVDVEPGNPNLFWSAGEDGTCRQFDARSRSFALLCHLHQVQVCLVCR
jgi:hypothetical protein